MYMKDFSYAGKRLSDFGCVLGYISTSLDNNVSLGSNIKFETIKNKNTNENRIVDVKYEEPDMSFKDTEVSYIMRWLNKRKYEKFCPIYDDGSYAEIYFKGSFNVSTVYIGGNIVGFTLTFTPNAPYGFETENLI